MTPGLRDLARQCFPATYDKSRKQFLDLCTARNLPVLSWKHPRLKGREGESLSVDVAIQGPENAERVLVLSSATHGIEGFCGAGVQAAVLRSGIHKELADGVALVLIHALNPYGFSYLRRTNEDNIDLNRNFIDYTKPRPVNSAYDAIHKMLVPPDWEGAGRKKADEELKAYLAKNGWSGLQAALSGGQYDHPDGLFFGGQYPAWSNTVWRDILKKAAGRARYLAALDFHTGLGARGACELISGAKVNSKEHALASALFKDTIVFPGITSTAPAAQGIMGDTLEKVLPQAQSALVVAEFGTVPFEQIFDVLRADNWLHVHGDLKSSLGQRIKNNMRDAFVGDTDQWGVAVLERSFSLFRQASQAIADI